MTDVKALAFDVFGTVVDWRTSVAREVAAVARARRLQVDASRFADEWRRLYQPSMAGKSITSIASFAVCATYSWPVGPWTAA